MATCSTVVQGLDGIGTGRATASAYRQSAVRGAWLPLSRPAATAPLIGLAAAAGGSLRWFGWTGLQDVASGTSLAAGR